MEAGLHKSTRQRTEGIPRKVTLRLGMMAWGEVGWDGLGGTNRPLLPAPLRMRRLYLDDTEADERREGTIRNAC